MKFNIFKISPFLIFQLFQIASAQELPTRVNNAEKNYFRPIFNQKNQECTQAAAIGYLFTYEINAARNLNASNSTNWYPSHFTYNFVNNANGNSTGMSDEALSIAKDMGVPNYITYGNAMNALSVTGWMNGYEKYLNAMQNRVADFFVVSTSNATNTERIKRWMFNHDGKTQDFGGLVVVNGFTGSWKYKTIPVGSYEAGKSVLYVTSKILTGGHTYVLVGYDDNIELDINADGLITTNVDINSDGKIDFRDSERGAFIMANSWGTNYKDNGFVYYMYQAAANFPNGQYGANVLSEYFPTYTIKVKIKCNQRDKINIKCGIASSKNATEPEFTKTFAGFNYKNGGTLPMNGTTNDPLEIGLDISDLVTKVSDINNATVFLQLISENVATLSGEITELSCLKYENKTIVSEYFAVQEKATVLPNTTLNMPISLSATSIVAIQNPEIMIKAGYRHLSISKLKPNSLIEIVGLDGIVLKKAFISDGEAAFDDLNSGVLLIRIIHKNQISTYKYLLKN